MEIWERKSQSEAKKNIKSKSDNVEQTFQNIKWNL